MDARLAWPLLLVLLAWSPASHASEHQAPAGERRSPPGDRPAWPAGAPAARAFSPDYMMFVERRGGEWHAWVLPDKMQWQPGEWTSHDHDFGRRGRVLDFFSGEEREAVLHVDGMGYTRQGFSTGDGRMHVPARLDGSPSVSLDLVHNRELHDLDFVDAEQLAPPLLEGCPTQMTVVDRMDRERGTALWSRLVLDRLPPTPTCPHGTWTSQLWSVLDLHDGTFLAAMDARVVRLRFEDLSPAGTAPTVRIMDADVVARILAAGGDMHERLDSALLDHPVAPGE